MPLFLFLRPRRSPKDLPLNTPNHSKKPPANPRDRRHLAGSSRLRSCAQPLPLDPYPPTPPNNPTTPQPHSGPAGRRIQFSRPNDGRRIRLHAPNADMHIQFPAPNSADQSIAPIAQSHLRYRTHPPLIIHSTRSPSPQLPPSPSHSSPPPSSPLSLHLSNRQSTTPTKLKAHQKHPKALRPKGKHVNLSNLVNRAELPSSTPSTPSTTSTTSTRPPLPPLPLQPPQRPHRRHHPRMDPLPHRRRRHPIHRRKRLRKMVLVRKPRRI
jgi:hypothetical protein